ncbi:MAG: DUF1611 domain-containing protein [Candidatus Aminicenantes bacterium]|nr:DUF1611 domain-containing protein [Candidatus Aminicenantes bacterium]
MTSFPEGSAIVYCEGAFGTPNGKTAHGLVRRTLRYEILSVIDSRLAPADAGEILDGGKNGIPVWASLKEAIDDAQKRKKKATFWIMGLAPDGGRLEHQNRDAVIQAVKTGLNVDSGLHDFLSEDSEISTLALSTGSLLRDVRKPPSKNDLHFFSGKIENVNCLKVAVLGTDSAVGKRTTACILTEAFQNRGIQAELIGTGQTAWMQGVRYGIILDSLINDFVAGEIEHVVWTAWNEVRPKVIIIEGQGSLMNPAYPGGFEILAAGRPDAVVLQHAPARLEYDGFPGYPLHPIDIQIKAIELLSGKPVAAITVNHENILGEKIPDICASLTKKTKRPAADVLLEGADKILAALMPYLKKYNVSQ